MKRRKLMLILTLGIICASATGCGENPISEEPEISIKAVNEAYDKVSDEEGNTSTNETDETNESEIVPTIDINTDASMNTVIINEATIDLDENPSLEQVLSSAGLSYSVGSTDIYNGLIFNSGMYGIEENTESSQTKVSIEVEDYMGKIVDSNRLKLEDFSIYTVKGVHTCNFFTGEDFSVFYCDSLTNGTMKSIVESVLGEGMVFNNDMIAYNNGTYTMLITYEEDTEANSEPLVDDIYLLKNNV